MDDEQKNFYQQPEILRQISGGAVGRPIESVRRAVFQPIYSLAQSAHVKGLGEGGKAQADALKITDTIMSKLKGNDGQGWQFNGKTNSLDVKNDLVRTAMSFGMSELYARKVRDIVYPQFEWGRNGEKHH